MSDFSSFLHILYNTQLEKLKSNANLSQLGNPKCRSMMWLNRKWQGGAGALVSWPWGSLFPYCDPQPSASSHRWWLCAPEPTHERWMSGIGTYTDTRAHGQGHWVEGDHPQPQVDVEAQVLSSWAHYSPGSARLVPPFIEVCAGGSWSTLGRHRGKQFIATPLGQSYKALRWGKVTSKHWGGCVSYFTNAK